MPDPRPGSHWFEVPAGLLDDDPGARPDRHIFVDLKAPWSVLADDLPRLTREQLYALRAAEPSRRRPKLR